MEFEKITERRSVREGYVVLLRATAELMLPDEAHPVMRSFYRRIADSCLDWATEIKGEQLRAHFLSLSDIRDKSRYRTMQYRFWMRIPWQEMPHMTILCESERTEPDGTTDFYRICHTWNTEEESILPLEQVLPLVQPKFSKKDLPFLPDGLYREGDKITVFQNRRQNNRFMEAKLPVKKDSPIL